MIAQLPGRGFHLVLTKHRRLRFTLFLSSCLSSLTIMRPDAQAGYLLVQQTHPLVRSALLKLQHLLPPLYSVVTLLPRSPLRRAPSADTDLPAPVLLQVALLRAPLL